MGQRTTIGPLSHKDNSKQGHRRNSLLPDLRLGGSPPDQATVSLPKCPELQRTPVGQQPSRRPGPTGRGSGPRNNSVGQIPPGLTMLPRSQRPRSRLLHRRLSSTQGPTAQAQALSNMGRTLHHRRVHTPGGLQAQPPGRHAGLPQQFVEH